MQDFVAHKPKKKPVAAKSLSKLTVLLMVLAGVILVIIFLLKSIHFGDFVRSQEKQTILLVYNAADKSTAYLLEADFSSLALAVYPLDSEVEIELGDYGNYRFQSVYPLLASVEKKPLNFVRSTYSFSLGRVIDEVWPVNQPLKFFTQKTELKSIFFSRNIWQLPGSLIMKGSWLALVSDPRTEFNFYNLRTSFPLETRSDTTDSSLFLCSIAVINTTSVNGLAGQIENVLSADGFSVIRTATDDQTLEKTELVVSTDKTSQQHCQRVQTKISKLLPGEATLKLDDGITNRYRADLVVKLGEDMK
ncbi:MAG: LytR C-terminal domain-containing protein [Patescibacteria group bacterium]